MPHTVRPGRNPDYPRNGEAVRVADGDDQFVAARAHTEKAFTYVSGKIRATVACFARPLAQSQEGRCTRKYRRTIEKEMDGRFDLNAAFAFEAVFFPAHAIKRATSDEPAAIHTAPSHRY